MAAQNQDKITEKDHWDTIIYEQKKMKRRQSVRFGLADLEKIEK